MMKKHKIIIVDDRENWREVLVELLNLEFGSAIDIYTSESYTNALETIKKYNFDLAIVDLRLQGDEYRDLHGLKLLREIKDISPKTKRVLITAYTGDLRNQVNQAIQEVDAFFEKVTDSGFDHQNFQDTIEKLLNS